MLQTYHAKLYSKGQLTIPKAVRDKLGLTDNAWVTIKIDKGGFVTRPDEPKKLSQKEKLQALLNLKTQDFEFTEVKQLRQGWQKRLERLGIK